MFKMYLIALKDYLSTAGWFYTKETYDRNSAIVQNPYRVLCRILAGLLAFCVFHQSIGFVIAIRTAF